MEILNSIEEGTFTIDKYAVAYKDGVCYPVEISDKPIKHNMCIGIVRVVTIDKKIVAIFTSTDSYSNGYRLLYPDNISEMRNIVKSYDTLKSDNIKEKAIEILAKYGAQSTVEELEEYIDDPNAVLKLSYCLEAVEAALLQSVNK